MSSEKTERATPRKRQQARERGQVARSQEISSAFVLAAGVCVLHFFWSGLIGSSQRYFEASWNGSLMRIVEDDNFGGIVVHFIWGIATIVAPLFAAVVAAALLINVAQTGGVFSLQPLSPNWDKINPSRGFKRIFSVRGTVELAKSIAKLTLIGVIAWMVISGAINGLLATMFMDLNIAVMSIENVAFSLASKLVLVLVILGILDFAYQRFEFEKQLKMSKQELREEYKQMEGDPLVRSKIREKGRQIAFSQMMQEVPEADVVVTNPSHIAVALKYDPIRHGAPLLLAKGKGAIAEKIKEIARDNGVTIYRDPPLAREIYSKVRVGEEIPESMFHSVAKILSYVYSVDRRRAEQAGYGQPAR